MNIFYMFLQLLTYFVWYIYFRKRE